MGKTKKAQNSDDGPTLESKYLEKLPEGFWESAQSMSSDELKKKLVEVETDISSTERDMKNDPKLLQAKEDVKILSQSYKEILTPSKAVVKAIVAVLGDRGEV